MAVRGGTTIALALLGVALIAVGPGSAGGGREWRTLTPSPLERTEVGASRVGDRIYVVGGYMADGSSTGRMARYDISADAWSEVAPLPIAVNHPGVTAHRGHLYVLGGFTDQNGPSDRLYRYHPGRDRWKRLPDMPTARGALGFVGIAGRLYAAGGTTATTGQFRGLEIFHLERRRWTEGPPMPTGRNHVGATAFKRGIIVTGGRTDGGANLDVVERYRRGRDGRKRWSEMPGLNVPRSGHAATTVSGAPVVFGGEQLAEGDRTIPETEIFDSRARDWTLLAPLTTPRHGLGGASRRGTVFAAEGGPQPGLSVSNTLESLTIP